MIMYILSFALSDFDTVEGLAKNCSCKGARMYA